jgi:hypothetical protein
MKPLDETYVNIFEDLIYFPTAAAKRLQSVDCRIDLQVEVLTADTLSTIAHHQPTFHPPCYDHHLRLHL